jgi:hypothetical protein
VWSKKRKLKRNSRISCNVHLLHELLETDVSAGKLRKLSELRSSVSERRLERTVLWPARMTVKTAQFTQFFQSGKISRSKIAQFMYGALYIGHLLRLIYVVYMYWLTFLVHPKKKVNIPYTFNSGPNYLLTPWSTVLLEKLTSFRS